jgi:hypothetical protein
LCVVLIKRCRFPFHTLHTHQQQTIEFYPRLFQGRNIGIAGTAALSGLRLFKFRIHTNNNMSICRRYLPSIRSSNDTPFSRNANDDLEESEFRLIAALKFESTEGQPFLDIANGKLWVEEDLDQRACSMSTKFVDMAASIGVGLINWSLPKLGRRVGDGDFEKLFSVLDYSATSLF